MKSSLHALAGKWGRRDLNPRPLGYEPSELPLLHAPSVVFLCLLGFAGRNLCCPFLFLSFYTRRGIP